MADIVSKVIENREKHVQDLKNLGYPGFLINLYEKEIEKIILHYM